ncbi:MAG TPA: ATP-binding protein [Kofleriaceae bacterium]|nr:ATP-binding protein [Kofleriaceae bacterium]
MIDRGGEEDRASILLVDDRPANLMALEATLEPLGQRLVRAASGAQALWRLLEEEFALILLDVQMPGMDGFQVASLLRERAATRHVPIIFLTALSRDASHIFQGYEHGAVDYLVKPFDSNILRAKVSVLVELYRKNKLIARQAELLRVREREALEQQSEHRFRSVTECIAGCVWVADLRGVVTYENRAAREFGDPMAAAGSELLAAIDADDRARGTAVWTASLASGESFELECRLVRLGDRCARWHIVRGVPQLDLQGLRSGWIVSAADIDDRKRAEDELLATKRQLEAASEVKDVFLAAASHELRSPLAATLAQVELALLQLGGNTTEFPGKAFALILRQIGRMSRLVGDLLDVSKIRAGRLSLESEPFDLIVLAGEVVERVQVATRKHAIRLDGPARMSVEADRGRLDQVLNNLLSNAIRYSPDGGEVEVQVWLEGGQVRLAVKDQGIGVPVDKQERIFDLFERAHSVSYGGLGLGLNIAQGIVEQHGGRIWVDSAGVAGLGSTFHVMLPIAPGEPSFDGGREQHTAPAVPSAADRVN